MCGLLSIEFYQPYFNVDTSEVTARLLQAAWPLQRNRSSTFLGEGESSQRADLYGPVWVSETDRVPQHPVMGARTLLLYVGTAWRVSDACVGVLSPTHATRVALEPSQWIEPVGAMTARSSKPRLLFCSAVML